MIRLSGKVKLVNKERGFGVITPHKSTGLEEDVFVHFSEIKSAGVHELERGQEVEYDAYLGGKGPVAKLVTIT